MASLELVDHTQGLKPWRLPEQQHGAQQLDTVNHAQRGPSAQKRMQRKAMERR